MTVFTEEKIEDEVEQEEAKVLFADSFAVEKDGVQDAAIVSVLDKEELTFSIILAGLSTGGALKGVSYELKKEFIFDLYQTANEDPEGEMEIVDGFKVKWMPFLKIVVKALAELKRQGIYILPGDQKQNPL